MLPFGPMSKWLSILLLACASAHAAPGAPPTDDIDRIVIDKGLLTQLVEVRQSMADKAYTVADNVAGKAHTVVDRTSDLVVTAMGFLGVPYRRGGSTIESGFDCSGFVRAMYQQTVGMMLPRRASQQAATTQIIDKKELQPGDLVFFNTMRRAFSHVGIYVGDGKFIHSPRSGSEVRVESMQEAYWVRRFDGARRVADAPTGTPAASN